jgi:hypothetical protein
MCELKDCKNEATRYVQFDVTKFVRDNHGGFRWVGHTKRWINNKACSGGPVISRDICDYHWQKIKQMIETLQELKSSTDDDHSSSISSNNTIPETHMCEVKDCKNECARHIGLRIFKLKKPGEKEDVPPKLADRVLIWEGTAWRRYLTEHEFMLEDRGWKTHKSVGSRFICNHHWKRVKREMETLGKLER